MNNASSVDNSGLIEKQVFNSILSTHTGGVTLDLTGYTGAVVPAGTLVSHPDPSTGLSKIVTITAADGEDPAEFDEDPLGLTESTVRVEDHTFVGVVTGGNVKVYCLPDDEQESFAAIHAVIPTLHATI